MVKGSNPNRVRTVLLPATVKRLLLLGTLLVLLFYFLENLLYLSDDPTLYLSGTTSKFRIVIMLEIAALSKLFDTLYVGMFVIYFDIVFVETIAR
jgi:hypothetical protein